MLELSLVPQLAADEQLVGTGGTIRNLAKIDRHIHPYPLPRLHGYTLQRGRVAEIATLLASRPLASRTAIPGLNPDRCDSITGGASAVWAVMRALAAKEMIVSGHGLREGLALDALGESVAPPNVVRQMSLAGLAARFSTWRSDVAARRTRLALLLLDSLDSNAGAPAREVLASAATILDIGQSVDYYNRYLHALRVLLEADLSGFSHRDTALLAATVSFAESEGSMRVYEPLIGPKDQRLVRRLAAILFAADHLQRLLSGKDDPHVERRGRKLSIGACVLDRGPLVEPVRRLGEAFGVDAQLVVDVRAA